MTTPPPCWGVRYTRVSTLKRTTRNRVAGGAWVAGLLVGQTILAAVGAGCGQTSLLGGSAAGEGGPGFLSAPADVSAVEGTVVRLVNESAYAVDVALFVSHDPEVRTAEDVISEANRFRAGVGFLSLGLLDVGESAEATLPCAPALSVATGGGAFLDRTTGALLAEGNGVRFVQLGPQFDCGDRITIRYGQDGQDQPVTTLRIE